MPGPLSNKRREQFCRLLALGTSPSVAYAQSGFRKDHGHSNGPKLAKRPEIAARVQEIMAEEDGGVSLLQPAEFYRHMAVSEIDNPAAHHARVLAVREEARRAKNFNAVAALDRLASGHLGMMKENLSITDERVLSDDALLEQISRAAGIPIEQLRPLLAKSGFSEPESNVTPIRGVR